MTEKTKNGLMNRLFGGSSKGNCCSIEIEEIPKPDPKRTEDLVQKKEEGKKNTGCCCCG